MCRVVCGEENEILVNENMNTVLFMFEQLK